MVRMGPWRLEVTPSHRTQCQDNPQNDPYARGLMRAGTRAGLGLSLLSIEGSIKPRLNLSQFSYRDTMASAGVMWQGNPERQEVEEAFLNWDPRAKTGSEFHAEETAGTQISRRERNSSEVGVGGEGRRPQRLGHPGPSELWDTLGFSLRAKKSYERVLRREGMALICYFNMQLLAAMERRTIRTGKVMAGGWRWGQRCDHLSRACGGTLAVLVCTSHCKSLCPRTYLTLQNIRRSSTNSGARWQVQMSSCGPWLSWPPMTLELSWFPHPRTKLSPTLAPERSSSNHGLPCSHILHGSTLALWEIPAPDIKRPCPNQFLPTSVYLW